MADLSKLAYERAKQKGAGMNFNPLIRAVGDVVVSKRKEQDEKLSTLAKDMPELDLTSVPPEIKAELKPILSQMGEFYNDAAKKASGSFRRKKVKIQAEQDMQHIKTQFENLGNQLTQMRSVEQSNIDNYNKGFSDYSSLSTRDFAAGLADKSAYSNLAFVDTSDPNKPLLGVWHQQRNKDNEVMKTTNVNKWSLPKPRAQASMDAVGAMRSKVEAWASKNYKGGFEGWENSEVKYQLMGELNGIVEGREGLETWGSLAYDGSKGYPDSVFINRYITDTYNDQIAQGITPDWDINDKKSFEAKKEMYRGQDLRPQWIDYMGNIFNNIAGKAIKQKTEQNKPSGKNPPSVLRKERELKLKQQQLQKTVVSLKDFTGSKKELSNNIFAHRVGDKWFLNSSINNTYDKGNPNHPGELMTYEQVYDSMLSKKLPKIK